MAAELVHPPDIKDGQISPVAARIINLVAEATDTPLDPLESIRQSVHRLLPWLPYFSPSEALSPHLSSFSHLVPPDLLPPSDYIHQASTAWQQVQEQGYVHPYVVVTATMGSTKSTTTEALKAAWPEAELHPEEYWNIPDLPAFYHYTRELNQALTSLSIPWSDLGQQVAAGIFPDGHIGTLLTSLHQAEIAAQSGFGANKFRQGIEAALQLLVRPVIQDTSRLDDTGYVDVHHRLGMISPENFTLYLKDTLTQQNYTPPHVRSPIFVHPLLSFQMLQTCIHQVRARDFEAGVPPNYLLELYVAAEQRILALAELGYPILVIDVENHDLRSQNGGLDRARQLWETIDQVHREQVLPRLGLT